MSDDERRRIDRRTVLKGIGAGTATIAGTSGVASAHHVQDITIEDVPDTVVAGESFECKVHWQSGHGSSACFISAIDHENWTQCGKEKQTALSVGEHRHFQLESTVPQSTDPGTYTFRVSASEAYHRCPHPGECRYPIKCAEAPDGGTVEVIPPVEVQDVQFKGCSEIWIAFDAFPVDSTTARVNVDGNWRRVTVRKSDLTKIPGHYGHDTPVFKYKADRGEKLVGVKIADTERTNDHRCAENV